MEMNVENPGLEEIVKLSNAESKLNRGDLEAAGITEELRSLCRIFDNAHDYIQHKMDVPLQVLETGSSTECCGPYADIDRMIFRKDFTVVEDVSQIPDGYDGCVLLVDTSCCYPGFTRLKVYQTHPDKLNMENLITVLNGESYLNAEAYKMFIINQYEDFISTTNTYVSLHGPAVMNSGHLHSSDRDLVACIECTFLPKRFIEVTKHLKESIVCPLTCHVVGTAHATSLRPELEFRMSFSLAEKRLIQEWTAKQAECYYRCKKICKITNNLSCYSNHDIKSIPSYFVKTVMFWLISEMPSNFWQQRSMSECVRTCFGRLTSSLLNMKLFSFFVPENNLLSAFKLHDVEIFCTTSMRINFSKQDDEKHIISEATKETITYLTKLRVNHTEYCKSYIFDLQRFILDLYSQNDNEQVNSTVLKEICLEIHQIIPDSLGKVCLFTVLYRCLALYSLSDAWERNNLHERENLLTWTQYFFEQSLQLPSEMITDHGVTGYVYLALLFSCTGNNEIAMRYLQKALKEREKLSHIWRIACVPVILPAGRSNMPPSYLGDDPMSTILMIRNASFIDPIALAIYLSYRLTDSIAMVYKFPQDLNYQCFGASTRLFIVLTSEVPVEASYFESICKLKKPVPLFDWVEQVIEILQIGELFSVSAIRVDILTKIFCYQLLHNGAELPAVLHVWNLIVSDQEILSDFKMAHKKELISGGRRKWCSRIRRLLNCHSIFTQ